MKKILLVDDDESIQLLYHEELVEKGYQVISAFNGQEGLQKFREETPDLVILDIQMPGMDGISLGKKIKSLVPEIREIFMTGYFPEDISKYKLPENAVFLQKPFTIEHLALKIKEALA